MVHQPWKTREFGDYHFGAGCLAAFILMLGAAASEASDRYWKQAMGDWAVGGNWSGGAVPTITDNAYVVNGGTASIKPPSATCTTLYLGGTSSGTVQLTSRTSLLTTAEYVGFQGTGTFIHIGGTNATGLLSLGAGGRGTYDLRGGQTAALRETVERLGTFSQSGGSNSALQMDVRGTVRQSGGFSSALSLNLGSGGTGTYALSGGRLSTLNEHIGYYRTSASGHGGTTYDSGVGIFVQSGGTNATTNLYVGYDNHGGNGAYNLSGGSLATAHEYIGGWNRGTFTQSGGTNTVSATLHFCRAASERPTYNLTGGVLVLKSIDAVASTEFNFGGGTILAGGSFTTTLDMTLTGDGGNATVDTAGHRVTLLGILSGAGGLNKLGAGTLVLGGADLYRGETNVLAGTLALASTGSVAKSSVIDVASGAFFDVSAKSGGFRLSSLQTLTGAGTVVGALTAASNSCIDPGDSVGTLTIANNLTLSSNVALNFELGATSASDLISMSHSTLSLNGLDFSDFNFTALDGFGAGCYTLIDAGAICGRMGSHLTGTIGGLSATLSLSASGDDLILTVVPEPSMLGLLLAAALGLSACCRHRRAGDGLARRRGPW